MFDQQIQSIILDHLNNEKICNIKFRKYHNLKLHNEICKSIIISIDDISPHKYSGKKQLKIV